MLFPYSKLRLDFMLKIIKNIHKEVILKVRFYIIFTPCPTDASVSAGLKGVYYVYANQ